MASKSKSTETRVDRWVKFDDGRTVTVEFDVDTDGIVRVQHDYLIGMLSELGWSQAPTFADSDDKS